MKVYASLANILLVACHTSRYINTKVCASKDAVYPETFIFALIFRNTNG